MVENEAMDMEKDISSNHDICVADEQEENGSSIADDEESNDIDDGKESDGDDSENEEEEDGDDGDSLHELTYQQQQAFETLSSIFRTLNVRPIHDR